MGLRQDEFEVWLMVNLLRVVHWLRVSVEGLGMPPTICLTDRLNDEPRVDLPHEASPSLPPHPHPGMPFTSRGCKIIYTWFWAIKLPTSLTGYPDLAVVWPTSTVLLTFRGLSNMLLQLRKIKKMDSIPLFLSWEKLRSSLRIMHFLYSYNSTYVYTAIPPDG